MKNAQSKKRFTEKPPFTYYVGQGNNSKLIRNLMENRPWWNEESYQANFSGVNFIWTAVKEDLIMDTLRCKLETPSLRTERLKAASLTRPMPNGSIKLSFLGKQSTTNYDTKTKLYNRLDGNHNLNNKSTLFINMKTYYQAMGEDPFNSLPVTFIVRHGLKDPEFVKFKSYFKMAQQSVANSNGKKDNIWIIKPGENSNQGAGIIVARDYSKIKTIVDQSTSHPKASCIL
jgi:hypothetical protein